MFSLAVGWQTRVGHRACPRSFSAYSPVVCHSCTGRHSLTTPSSRATVQRSQCQGPCCGVSFSSLAAPSQPGCFKTQLASAPCICVRFSPLSTSLVHQAARSSPSTSTPLRQTNIPEIVDRNPLSPRHQAGDVVDDSHHLVSSFMTLAPVLLPFVQHSCQV